jgi:hypothetical protein
MICEGQSSSPQRPLKGQSRLASGAMGKRNDPDHGVEKGASEPPRAGDSPPAGWIVIAFRSEINCDKSHGRPGPRCLLICQRTGGTLMGSLANVSTRGWVRVASRAKASP